MLQILVVVQTIEMKQVLVEDMLKLKKEGHTLMEGKHPFTFPSVVICANVFAMFYLLEYFNMHSF